MRELVEGQAIKISKGISGVEIVAGIVIRPTTTDQHHNSTALIAPSNPKQGWEITEAHNFYHIAKRLNVTHAYTLPQKYVIEDIPFGAPIQYKDDTTGVNFNSRFVYHDPSHYLGSTDLFYIEHRSRGRSIKRCNLPQDIVDKCLKEDIANVIEARHLCVSYAKLLAKPAESIDSIRDSIYDALKMGATNPVLPSLLVKYKALTGQDRPGFMC